MVKEKTYIFSVEQKTFSFVFAYCNLFSSSVLFLNAQQENERKKAQSWNK